MDHCFLTHMFAEGEPEFLSSNCNTVQLVYITGVVFVAYHSSAVYIDYELTPLVIGYLSMPAIFGQIQD